MKKLLLLLMALALPVFTGAAQAQRDSGENWELIGQRTVGFGVDRDVIPISDNDSWHRDRAFRQLRFIAEGNDVFMINIRLVYVNGYGEDIRVDKLIPVGGQIPVPLGGDRKYLRQIEMTYKSKPGLRIDSRGLGLQQAVVKVYGEQARRELPRGPVYGGGWEPIDTQRFERTSEGFEFRNTRPRPAA